MGYPATIPNSTIILQNNGSLALLSYFYMIDRFPPVLHLIPSTYNFPQSPKATPDPTRPAQPSRAPPPRSPHPTLQHITSLQKLPPARISFFRQGFPPSALSGKKKNLRTNERLPRSVSALGRFRFPQEPFLVEGRFELLEPIRACITTFGGLSRAWK